LQYRAVLDDSYQAALAAINGDTLVADGSPPLPELVAAALAALSLAGIARVAKRAARKVLQPVLGVAAEEATVTIVKQMQQRWGTVLPDAVRSTLARLVAQAQAEHLSVPQTAALLIDEVKGLVEWQANMLARTDLVAIANHASEEAVHAVNERSAKAGQPLIQYKRWLTSHDERVRDTHRAVDGQPVPVGQSFTVGLSQLRFPGDPLGSIDETANCRCTLTFHDTLTASPQPTLPSEDTSMSTTITINDTPGTATETRWRSLLALEGAPTSDGRFLIPDQIGFRDLPLTLMAQVKNEGGHTGSEPAGRIDRVWKEPAPDLGDDVIAWWGEGVFDSGEFGTEIARMVENQVLRGISVDFAELEVAFINPDTREVIADVDPEDMFAGNVWMGLSGTIGAATVCFLPAFADATISILTAGNSAVVASTFPIEILNTLVAAVQPPLRPPRAWFEQEEADELTPLTVTDEGMVFGHAATWDCHTGFQDRCVMAPQSQTGYAYFHTGEIETAEGDLIPVGNLTVNGGHADLALGRSAAKRHYDDAGTVVAFLRATDGKHGIWVSGVLRDDITEQQLRDMRANAPSGDWRAGEMIALHCVPVQGFPVPRTQARVLVASSGETEVATLITAPVDGCDCDEGMGEHEFQVRVEALAELAGV
jgi:hypothetical protein